MLTADELLHLRRERLPSLEPIGFPDLAPDPVVARLENGFLVIEARRESFGNQEYTSARLKTQGLAYSTSPFVPLPQGAVDCARGIPSLPSLGSTASVDCPLIECPQFVLRCPPIRPTFRL